MGRAGDVVVIKRTENVEPQRTGIVRFHGMAPAHTRQQDELGPNDQGQDRPENVALGWGKQAAIETHAAIAWVE